MYLYVIEEAERGNSLYGCIGGYRFVSLFNGTRGPWVSRETAEKQGIIHQRIILAAYPNLQKGI